MKPTIWIFSLEPLETRYTAQWHSYIPALLRQQLGNDFNIVRLDGIQKNSKLTPGAFLNFSDTNYWKSSQLCNFLDEHNNGKTSKNDHFLFTDAWNPIIIQIKYMSELLGFNWKIHGQWHAGSYDCQDFLGRLIGNAPWVRHAEKSFFHAIDYNYFATDFHINMFCENLLEEDLRLSRMHYLPNGKIIRTGWPMAYMPGALDKFKNLPKRDLILFPHRIAPEKQVEIFRDLATLLPQYEFIVCQDQQLTKKEYHTLLGEAKMVFSASLQETLGIGCYEGAIVGALPIVPDRLSYSEMYFDEFKYPSKWTENLENYQAFKLDLCKFIIAHMTNYEHKKLLLDRQTTSLTENFFSATEILNNFKEFALRSK